MLPTFVFLLKTNNISQLEERRMLPVSRQEFSSRQWNFVALSQVGQKRMCQPECWWFWAFCEQDALDLVEDRGIASCISAL
jgi:hypothetical protein